MTEQSRDPSGIPTGGRFASTHRPAVAVALHPAPEPGAPELDAWTEAMLTARNARSVVALRLIADHIRSLNPSARYIRLDEDSDELRAEAVLDDSGNEVHVLPAPGDPIGGSDFETLLSCMDEDGWGHREQYDPNEDQYFDASNGEMDLGSALPVNLTAMPDGSIATSAGAAFDAWSTAHVRAVDGLAEISAHQLAARVLRIAPGAATAELVEASPDLTHQGMRVAGIRDATGRPLPIDGRHEHDLNSLAMNLPQEGHGWRTYLAEGDVNRLDLSRCAAIEPRMPS